MQQKKWIYWIVSVSIVTTLLGFILGHFIISPDELASKSSAPNASLISVPVEEKVLSANLSLRGEIGASESVEVLSPTSSNDQSNIVLAVAEVGQTINEGESVANISGRPVIVLQGSIRSFRAITAGIEGEDVRQLNESLTRLGLKHSSNPQIFDASAQAGVVELYKKAGFKATEPTKEEKASLSTAQKEVSNADAAYRTAIATLSGTELNAARSEESVALAELNSATAVANTNNVVASQELATANATVIQLNADRVYNAGLLATAQSGINPYNNLAPSNPSESSELGVIVSELTSKVNSLIQQVSAANSDVNSKTSAVTSASAAGAASIAAATNSYNDARAKREDIERRAAKTSSDPDVKSAKDSLDAANKTLGELSLSIGFKIPFGEIVFVPTAPTQVESVNISKGEFASDPIMTLATSNLEITSSVATADIKFVKLGQKAQAISDNSGKSINATVSRIAPGTGTDGAGENRYAIWLTPDEDEVEELNDDESSSVKVSIPVTTTDGKVLAVPLSALSVDGDSKPRVEIVIDNDKDKTEFVSVETGLRAQGYVEIKSNKKIKKGIKVIVGNKKKEKSS